MAGEKLPNSTIKEMLVIIGTALACTAVMMYLDAFEKLYTFSRVLEHLNFDELSVFFPSFMAMGFVIYAYRKVQDLEIAAEERKEIEKALLKSEEMYRELSITDSLTKLYNARHFSFVLESECDRVTRYDFQLSILLLDVDDFKRYNDTFGHFEGDKILTKLGEVIAVSLRRIDTAFRYGGEEFAVVLPETDEKEAINAAERIRKRFESETLHLRPSGEARCTISVGVAQYVPGEDIQTLLRRVDKAMYQAKEMGKNQVHLAQI